MSNPKPAGDYVLGTDVQELERLGRQHEVWRAEASAGWRTAGVREGARVLDVGAGPGFATVDLARMVGPTGQVVALERSQNFLHHLAAVRERESLAQVEIREADLMQPFPVADGSMDAAWCRWVACFVQSPATLVRHLAAALRPGGRVIFHEYYHYATWRFAPPSAPLEEFVERVMQSWRSHGGEPDIAMQLPELLAQAGLRMVGQRPLALCVGPQDPIWQWPASFVNINLERLQSLGLGDAAWADSVRASLRELEAKPWSLVMTPLVLEIVAEKK